MGNVGRFALKMPVSEHSFRRLSAVLHSRANPIAHKFTIKI